MSINPLILIKKDDMNCSQDVISYLYHKRIIFLDEEINHKTTTLVVSQLIYLDSLSHDDIQLYINSPGGSVTDAKGIIDTMNFIKSDVRTICIGEASSAAVLIATSGAKGKRCSLPSTYFMIHQPSSGISGKATDIKVMSTHIEEVKKDINTLLAKQTGQDIKRIRKDTEVDFYLTADEALKYGLIDQIIA